jgi:dTDP-6-deoxy-L-talose 4-dehydrogenase (NAD+)
MEKILVTGATGFIGQHVVHSLLRKGCRVIATSANEQRAEAHTWFGQAAYFPLDLSRYDPGVDYFQFFGRPDRMIHLAWEGLPNYRSAFHLEVNLPRHVAFLANMLNGGLSDLTVTGTCLEYGMQEGSLSETQAAVPGNPYAQAKDSLRRYLERRRELAAFQLRWIRLFYLYGKGQNPNSLFSQLDKALAEREPVFNMSGGEQVRDFLPVETAADYVAIIALQNKITGIINCCSGTPVTVRQMVQRHLERVGGKIKLNLGYYPYPDYEPFRFWGDPSKLKTILEHE